MKGKLLLLISLLSLSFYSCEDSNSDSETLEVSEPSFTNISNSGTTLNVDVTSNSTWTVSNTAKWCTVTPLNGSNNQQLKIKVDANLNSTKRTTTITVTLASNGTSRTISLSQDGGQASNAESYHYELPVIFHVFYKSKADPLQYVSQSRLAEILNVVNDNYKDTKTSVDMNLTFTLPTTDANGKVLETPGVEYISWPKQYPIDCEKFMSDNSGEYVKYLWDPNKYINVMVYNFTDDNSGSVTLGISHIPYTSTNNHPLEGLNNTQFSELSLSNLKYPLCVSINSLYINKQSNGTNYYTDDVTVTFAHELGHYLGLHHAFSETKEGEIADDCIDSDYCKDTPTYNKVYYDQWLNEQIALGVSKFEPLTVRENCQTNQPFNSHNIMDYAISYSDQFTADQRTRIRHVLNYSPLIPGPKIGKTNTRTAHEGPLDLPIRTVK